MEDKQTDNDSRFCKKLKDIDKALQSEYTNTPSVEDCKTVKNCIFYIFTHYGTRIFLAMLLFSYFHLFLLAYLGSSELIMTPCCVSDCAICIVIGLFVSATSIALFVVLSSWVYGYCCVRYKPMPKKIVEDWSILY